MDVVPHVTFFGSELLKNGIMSGHVKNALDGLVEVQYRISPIIRNTIIVMISP